MTNVKKLVVKMLAEKGLSPCSSDLRDMVDAYTQYLEAGEAVKKHGYTIEVNGRISANPAVSAQHRAYQMYRALIKEAQKTKAPPPDNDPMSQLIAGG